MRHLELVMVPGGGARARHQAEHPGHPLNEIQLRVGGQIDKGSGSHIVILVECSRSRGSHPGAVPHRLPSSRSRMPDIAGG